MINSREYPDGYGDYPYLDYLRFDLEYVNNDDIPKLFLCTGDGGADTVSIYFYNAESRSVEKWGEFSSRGRLYYCEKQRNTISEYGNYGYFPMFMNKLGMGCGTSWLLKLITYGRTAAIIVLPIHMIE